MDKSTELILTLLNLKGIGNIKAEKILNNISIDSSVIQDDILLKTINNFNPLISKDDYNDAKSRGKKEIEIATKNNIEIINYKEDRYPNRITSIKNKPLVLYCKGNIALLNEKNIIAVIGTRKPSEFAIKYANRLSRLLSNKKIVVVSGLAEGIDSVAHLGSERNSFKTIAVLPNGLLDEIRPKKNIEIANILLQNEGLLISEYGLYEKPRKGYYVSRNRIQSGISDAVIMIESKIDGGSMHTVNFAMEQSRLLGVLNHPKNQLKKNDQAIANQNLIEKQYAKPIYSLESVEEFIELSIENKYNIMKLNPIKDLKPPDKQLNLTDFIL